jgi:hypothetical protein
MKGFLVLLVLVGLGGAAAYAFVPEVTAAVDNFIAAQQQ